MHQLCIDILKQLTQCASPQLPNCCPNGLQVEDEPLTYKRGQHLRGIDAENADRVQAEMVSSSFTVGSEVYTTALCNRPFLSTAP